MNGLLFDPQMTAKKPQPPPSYLFQKKLENEQPVKLQPGRKGKEKIWGNKTLNHRLLESDSPLSGQVWF